MCVCVSVCLFCGSGRGFLYEVSPPIIDIFFILMNRVWNGQVQTYTCRNCFRLGSSTASNCWIINWSAYVFALNTCACSINNIKPIINE